METKIKHNCEGQVFHQSGQISGWGNWKPCSKKASVEFEGKHYCGLHEPAKVQAKKDNRHEAFEADCKLRSEFRQWLTDNNCPRKFYTLGKVRL